MRNAAHYGRCLRRAMQWDGHGHGLAQHQLHSSGLDDDPGFEISVYPTLADFRAALAELGIAQEQSETYERCGVMLQAPGKRVYIFNSNGNYGRLDVEQKQMSNLGLLKDRLMERINGARHVRS